MGKDGITRAIDRYVLSWLIIAVSFWAAWVLARPPSNFAAFPVAFQVVASAGWPEEAWAIFIGGGAVMHSMGMILRVRGLDLDAARIIGFIGLSVETIFWLLFGLTGILANPDTLFGAAGLAIGIGAAWRLSRYGWSPDV